MTDAFISYSRRDEPLVRRLHQVLKERGKDAWIDWEDIPASTDWIERIYLGIREANVFVFVMSPDSLSSEMCARELEYAVEIGKRIVPLLGSKMGDAVVPPSLRKVQWIQFESWKEASVDRLVEALEKDPNWVQEHSRWFQAAFRWESNNHDASTLLRGSELRAAESWLSSEGAEARDPAPTPLQSRFVLESRQAETRRQRRTRIATVAALVVAIGLSVVALLQRNQAVDESRSAESRALSANAFLNLSTDPELSLLLARQAIDVRPTAEAEDALRQALIASRVRATLTGHDEALSDVAFSPDGAVIATGSEDKTARLWDSGDMDEIATLKGHKAPIKQVQFSPTGEYLATVADDGTARLWDPRDGSALQVFHHPDEFRVTDIAFSPDGSILATSGFVNGKVLLWSTSTGKALQEIPVEMVDQIAFSPDGQHLAVDSQQGPPMIWDPRSGRRSDVYPDGDLEVGFDSDMGYSPDGKRFAIAGGGFADESVEEARLLDQNGSLIATLDHTGSVNDIAYSSDAALVATASDDATARIWSAKDGALQATLSGHTGPVNTVGFNDDKTLLVTASDDGTARIWEVRTGRTVAELSGHTGSVDRAEFDPSGESIVTAGRDGTARLWAGTASGGSFDVLSQDEVSLSARLSAGGTFLVDDKDGIVQVSDAATGELTDVPPLSDQNEILDVSPDGTAIVTPGKGGTTLIARGETAGDSVALNTPSTAMYTSFSDDGELLAVADSSGYIEVWDADGEDVARLRPPANPDNADDPATPGTGAQSLDLSAEGETLVTSSNTGVDIWDVGSGGIMQGIDAFLEEPEGMANTTFASLNSDGSKVVTAAIYEDVARVWDVPTGELIAELRGHTGGVYTASFGAEDSLVATGGTDGTVRVWQVQTGRQLVALRDRNEGVTQVTFAADGSAIRSLGDAQLVSYKCTVCGSVDDLVHLSSERITRELSSLENRTVADVAD